jgi:hypothetical protein
MSLSSGGLTGVVVAIMILVRPANVLLGWVGIRLVALALIVVSLPVRKGGAIAINWLVAWREEDAG